MIGEAITGLGAVKTAFDLAKALKDINDATVRNRAIIELQEKILAARDAQTALLERVSELEKQVAGFEKWEAEKERYSLKEIYPHNFAYAINEDARGSEPPHLICAACYQKRKKFLLQSASYVHLECPECKARVQYRESQSLQQTNYSPRGGPNSWMRR